MYVYRHTSSFLMWSTLVLSWMTMGSRMSWTQRRSHSRGPSPDSWTSLSRSMQMKNRHRWDITRLLRERESGREGGGGREGEREGEERRKGEKPEQCLAGKFTWLVRNIHLRRIVHDHACVGVFVSIAHECMYISPIAGLYHLWYCMLWADTAVWRCWKWWWRLQHLERQGDLFCLSRRTGKVLLEPHLRLRPQPLILYCSVLSKHPWALQPIAYLTNLAHMGTCTDYVCKLHTSIW